MTHDDQETDSNRHRIKVDEGLDAFARRLEEWLSEARERSADLRNALAQAISSPVSPHGSPAPDPLRHGPEWESLAEAVRQMEAQADRTSILSRLMGSAAELAPRVVLFVLKGGVLSGSAGRGLPAGFSARSVIIPAGSNCSVELARSEGDFVLEMTAARPENMALLEALGGQPAEWMLAAPLWIRDRVAAVLYADTPDAGDWHPDPIRVLASVAALSLEAVPARTRHPRPQPAPRAATGPNPVTTGPAAEKSAPASESHEDARRFARLLVSEIVLYNAAQIEEGRRHKDIYERLSDDIDRSYRMFEERHSGRTPAAASVFREELVRTLAGGDESAIHLPWD